MYYTEQWDVGPGDTCSFPTKWMSEDGKTMLMASSGSFDDYNLTLQKIILATEPKKE